MNKLLEKAAKSLGYLFTELVEDNALHVCIAEDDTPFMILLCAKEYPDTIIISLAADFPDTFITTNVILDLIGVSKLELSDSFYITETGTVTIGKDADLKRMLFESEDLMNMQALSNTKN